MSTVQLFASRNLLAEAARVWSVLADYGQDPHWRTGVVAMTASTPGFVSPGTTTREELRLGGRTWINEGVIDEVDPGRLLRWHTVRGADAAGTRRVEPSGTGSCRVTLELEVRPHGLERLMAPVLKRVLVRNLRRDLERLETVVASTELQATARTAVP